VFDRRNNIVTRHKEAYLVSAFCILSVVLFTAAWRRWMPLDLIETLGFVTGIACVYLTIKENIWNFPIGLANVAFLLVLFVGKRLFADSALQVVYFVLGVHGWYLWLHGGAARTTLKVSRTSTLQLSLVYIFILISTPLWAKYLANAHDSAPWLDAFTTALSLGAQYLLNCKLLENWYFWIFADIVYVYLYASRGLWLTAVLYGIFLGLCFAGVRQWRLALAQNIVPGAFDPLPGRAIDEGVA
jgi:nicotinamide mononucleotide transporter